jgi:queuine tRNA-ribosyltransferase
MKFTLIKKDSGSSARAGTLELAHGTIETPAFMPVGTRAAVKTLTTSQLHEIGASIILGNTYHLFLKPGKEIIEKAGGLHAFMQWDRNILTDSGGFQVFSLSHGNQITDEGVYFKSHIDGSRKFLGPQESMEMQRVLGADIVMMFDECPPYPCEREQMEAALRRTHNWAKICRDFPLQSHQNLFGIVQGGSYEDLREASAKELVALDCPGYAIGGVSVGESTEVINRVVAFTAPLLPEEKPRYLMGVGTPRNIIEAVMRGIDMFDCVMPTRNARNGTAFTWQGKISIKAGRYADDFSPLDPELNSYASQFSKAYIRHLFNVGEITGITLITMQNLAFYIDFMKKLRQSIVDGSLPAFYEKVCAIYPQENDESML